MEPAGECAQNQPKGKGGEECETNMGDRKQRVTNLISVDVNVLPWEQKVPLHNRWHPEIPPVAEVREGEIFRVEMLDCVGGQIQDNDCADDAKDLDTTQAHYLSGPIRVETAKPGDLLKVEILNCGPLPGDEWGYTATLYKAGFLCDHYPEATKAIWDLAGIYATSRHIPGVKFAGMVHPGLIGTAPSKELLQMWNEREAALVAEEGTEKGKSCCSVVAIRPLMCPPSPEGSLLGKLGHFSKKLGKDKEFDRISAEAARTVPGRENGGNCDIKNLSRGSTVYLPVFVDGANLSVGDMHFSQGDGEISFCGAIEMAGFLELRVSVIKEGMKLLPAVGPSPLSVSPLFEVGPLEPRYSEYLVFEGISVDEQGKQHYLDATLAFKRACLNAIKYLSQFGYTEEQVYILLSCCPCEGRISGIVDVPNACATLAIPLAIFDKDVRPSSTGDAGDVIRALSQGVRLVKKSDIAHMTNDNPPKNFDPRLPH